MPLVPRQLLRTRRSDRRQHDRHARSLQRLEQHPPPVPRPHDAADLARALLARLTTPARAYTASVRPPPSAGYAHPGASSAPTGRVLRDPHDDPRCERGSSSTYGARYQPNACPTARSDPSGSAPANAGSSSSESPANRGRSGSEPLSPESPHLALQAGGRRFEPGTLHNETRCKRRVSRFRGGNVFPCGRKRAAPVAYCEPMVDVAQPAREASPPPTSAAGCTPRTELERSPAPRSADGGASGAR